MAANFSRSLPREAREDCPWAPPARKRERRRHRTERRRKRRASMGKGDRGAGGGPPADECLFRRTTGGKRHFLPYCGRQGHSLHFSPERARVSLFLSMWSREAWISRGCFPPINRGGACGSMNRPLRARPVAGGASMPSVFFLRVSVLPWQRMGRQGSRRRAVSSQQ